MNTIGQRVRAARQKLGYTMKQLHDLSGLSTGNISDIENDRNAPSSASLIPLARSLECSLDWLMTGEETNARSAEQSLVCDGVPLSESEADLIAMFRLLPGDHQEDVYEIVRSKYDRLVEKKGSYYSACIEAEEAQESGPAESREARDGTA